MLFIDLDKLAITKSFKFETREIDVNYKEQMSIYDFAQEIFPQINEMINYEQAPTIECCYNIHIQGDGIASEEESADFLSLVNVCLTQFCRAMQTAEGRNREHRLDVPENLKCVKTSMSLLKKLINFRTVVQVFNVRIYYKDLMFILCDDKEIPTADFIHDEGELDA